MQTRENEDKKVNLLQTTQIIVFFHLSIYLFTNMELTNHDNTRHTMCIYGKRHKSPDHDPN